MKIKFQPSIVALLSLAFLAFWFVAKKSGFTPSSSPTPSVMKGKVGKLGGECGYTRYKGPNSKGTFEKCWKKNGTCSLSKSDADSNIKSNNTTLAAVTGICQ